MDNFIKKERINIKVITAIGNQNLNDNLKESNEIEIVENDNLKESNEIEIVENDISYREGILEILEKNKNIDLIILYEKLLGEISWVNLINEIKKINNEINIFFILENKNTELEILLENNKIKKFFFINEINIKNLIKEIKNIKLNNNEKLFEEIESLKNIIKEKDDELIKYKNNNLESKKTILIMGSKNVGKTTILSNFQIVDNNNFEFIELNIDDYFEIEKRISRVFKIIFISEMNYEKIKINKNKIEKIILNNKINYNNVYIIFNKINNYSINKKIAKNILKKIKILGYIKFSNYCDYKINKKNNYDNENKKLKKYYFKILNKLKRK